MSIALSWSRLSDYQSCPRKFYLKYVEKAFPPEDPKKSIHLIKGEQYHRQLENYVLAKNGQGDMPVDFSPAVADTLPVLDKLYSAFQNVYPEAQIACDYSWKPQDWFGSAVAWRAIWDCVALNPNQALIIDYKSGKVYDYTSQYGQLHLSAAIALNRFDIEYVDVAYLYIEHKKTTKFRVTQEDNAKVMKFFESEHDRVNADKEFKPTANEYCKYCPAVKSQCQFSRKL